MRNKKNTRYNKMLSHYFKRITSTFIRYDILFDPAIYSDKYIRKVCTDNILYETTAYVSYIVVPVSFHSTHRRSRMVGQTLSGYSAWSPNVWWLKPSIRSINVLTKKKSDLLRIVLHDEEKTKT